MLDAISDFWKPSRKTDNTDQIDGASIKPGCSIGFGFIPQAELSGKRALVKEVNTYVFDPDRMTSFVLEADADTIVSMIIADSEQEKYIAISRKIPFSERAALFENNALLACMDGDEKKRLNVKNQGKWASWTASEYKKAIGGLKGKILEGDFRSLNTIPNDAKSKEFNYTLLVSNNNEFALEIEQYSDNKMEVYATVYRRLTDIGEIAPPRNDSQMEFTPPQAKKVAKTAGELSALKPANDSEGDKGSKSQQKKEAEQEFTPAPKPAPRIEEDDIVEMVRAISEDEKKLVLDPTPDVAPEKPAEQRQTLGEISLDSSDSDVQPSALSGPQFSSEESVDDRLSSLPDAIEPVKDVLPSLDMSKAKETKDAKEAAFFEAQEKASAPVQQSAQEAKQEAEPTPAKSQADELDNLKVAEPVEVPVNTEQAEPTEEAPAAPVELSPLVEEQDSMQGAEETQETEAFEEKQPQETYSTTQEEPKEQTMATFNANINGNNEPKVEPFQARAISHAPQEVENDSVECELPAASRVIEEAIRNEMSMSDVIRRVVALPVARQESVSIPVMLTDSDYSLLAVRYGLPAADRAAIKAKIIEEIQDFSGK